MVRTIYHSCITVRNYLIFSITYLATVSYSNFNLPLFIPYATKHLETHEEFSSSSYRTEYYSEPGY